MVPCDWRKFLDLLRGEVQAGRIADEPHRRRQPPDPDQEVRARPVRAAAAPTAATPRRSAARRTARSPARRCASRRCCSRTASACCRCPRPASKIFVAGKSADDIGSQSGGWTITWQGGPGAITPGTTILQGIRGAVVAAARRSPTTATATASTAPTRPPSPWSARRPTPRATATAPAAWASTPSDLATIARLRATGVPVIVVLVSGRPLDIAAELPGWDALRRRLAARHRGRRRRRRAVRRLQPDRQAADDVAAVAPRSSRSTPATARPPLFPLGAGRSGSRPPSAPTDLVGAAYYDEQRRHPARALHRQRLRPERRLDHAR